MKKAHLAIVIGSCLVATASLTALLKLRESQVRNESHFLPGPFHLLGEITRDPGSFDG